MGCLPRSAWFTGRDALTIHKIYESLGKVWRLELPSVIKELSRLITKFIKFIELTFGDHPYDRLRGSPAPLVFNNFEVKFLEEENPCGAISPSIPVLLGIVDRPKNVSPCRCPKTAPMAKIALASHISSYGNGPSLEQSRLGGRAFPVNVYLSMFWWSSNAVLGKKMNGSILLRRWVIGRGIFLRNLNERVYKTGMTRRKLLIPLTCSGLNGERRQFWKDFPRRRSLSHKDSIVHQRKIGLLVSQTLSSVGLLGRLSSFDSEGKTIGSSARPRRVGFFREAGNHYPQKGVRALFFITHRGYGRETEGLVFGTGATTGATMGSKTGVVIGSGPTGGLGRIAWYFRELRWVALGPVSPRVLITTEEVGNWRVLDMQTPLRVVIPIRMFVPKRCPMSGLDSSDENGLHHSTQLSKLLSTGAGAGSLSRSLVLLV
ncbi:hypothetical protein Tco_0816355 [Tanacetum coccineum]